MTSIVDKLRPITIVTKEAAIITQLVLSEDKESKELGFAMLENVNEQTKLYTFHRIKASLDLQIGKALILIEGARTAAGITSSRAGIIKYNEG